MGVLEGKEEGEEKGGKRVGKGWEWYCAKYGEGNQSTIGFVKVGKGSLVKLIVRLAKEHVEMALAERNPQMAEVDCRELVKLFFLFFFLIFLFF